MQTVSNVKDNNQNQVHNEATFTRTSSGNWVSGDTVYTPDEMKLLISADNVVQYSGVYEVDKVLDDDNPSRTVFRTKQIIIEYKG